MTARPVSHGTPGSPGPGGPPVEIRRSARRRRTVQGRMEGETFVVLMPTGLSATEEARHVDNLLTRHLRAQARRRLEHEDLPARAAALSQRYLGGLARPTSIVWVTNQQQRWGSCSPSTGAIRLSTNLEGMPDWVVDSVIVHELAHLLEPNHGPRFRSLVERYPRYAESTAFLRGVAWVTGRSGGEQGEEGEDDLE